MLPEVGGLEWIIIAAVALIVIGPKDLPVMMRRVGQFVAKLRGMANEFRASFDEMARQSELDDLRKEVEAMRRGQFGSSDFGGEMRSTVNEIEQQMADVGVQLHPPMSYQYDAAEALPPLEISEAPPAEAPAAPKKGRARKKATNGAAPAPAAKPKRAAKPKAEIVETAKPARKRASKIVEGEA